MLQPVQVALSPEDKFREYLASRPRPQRFTGPQRDIVRYVFSSHNHFDADQLCGDMVQAGYNVSRATVYRTLNKLVDAGLLRRLDFGPRVVFEHDYGYPQHEHLCCQKCGKVIEFQSQELEDLYQEVCRRHQFQPTHFTFVIKGTCAECNRKRMTKRRLDLV